MPAKKRTFVRKTEPEPVVAAPEPAADLPIRPFPQVPVIIPAEAVVTPMAPVTPAVVHPEPVIEETKPEVDQVAQLAEVKEEELREENGGGGWVRVVAGVVVGLVLGSAAGYVVGSMGSKKTMQVRQIQGVKPTVTPAPSEAAQPDRSQLKVQVLNGSGVRGKAAEVKDFLESAGYSGVGTGNADGSDYARTEVAIKAGKKGYWEVLKKDLEKRYKLAGEATALPDSSGFDAVVTVGKE